MSVLITGGAGFLGLAVARQLLAEGQGPVAVFSRAPTERRLGDLAGRVTAIAGDVGNFAHVLEAVKRVRPRTIYHLGAMLSVPSEADPAASIQTNAMGAFHVLEAARLFDAEQVIFASSIGTYGHGLGDGPIDDMTPQRPVFLYGATKIFGEHLGLFYKRKHGLDFRGIRYPSVVGPGVETKGAAQYTSWMIEKPARGEAYTAWVRPDIRMPIMYITEAAVATVRLAQAPVERIRMVNYLVNGVTPTPSAAELAAIVRDRIPGARIGFEPDPAIQPLLDELVRPVDDRFARAEWGWQPTHSAERIVDDFLAAMGR